MAGKKPQRRSLKPVERETKQDVFLTAFARTGIILTGCRAAGVTRQAVDGWKKKPSFAARYAEAEAEANDVLRAEILRRGLDGLVRKKFTGKGEPVIDPDTGEQYVEREYSDSLLLTAAKARMPEYREKQDVTLNGQLGVRQIIYAPTIAAPPPTAASTDGGQ